MKPITRTRTGHAAIVAATAAVMVVGAAAPAVAAGSMGRAVAHGKPKNKPAVISPLLNIFAFGANVGLPLGCGAVSSALGEEKAAGPLVLAINKACATIQKSGTKDIALAQSKDSPLAAWNPFVNPFIALSSSALTTIGDKYSTSVSPFGPTVAGLGGMMDFFEGS